jgi:hypothetical protein
MMNEIQAIVQNTSNERDEFRYHQPVRLSLSQIADANLEDHHEMADLQNGGNTCKSLINLTGVLPGVQEEVEILA